MESLVRKGLILRRSENNLGERCDRARLTLEREDDGAKKAVAQGSAKMVDRQSP
jgi:hypothetical protein